MTDVHILKVGIASMEKFKARTIAIARGEYKPSPDEPKIWFSSPESFAQVLSGKNQALLALIAKLDRFDLIILDDLSYVRKDQAETSVLFELIAERYERKSLLITANQPFSGWNNVFPDPGMTLAAIDRLVHHSTNFELNVESYRRRNANDKQKERRRQLPTDNHDGATITNIRQRQLPPSAGHHSCRAAGHRS
jgi:hypothetical protein